MACDTALYAALGVAPDATAAALKKAFRREMTSRYFPDPRPGQDNDAAELHFAAVTAAYAVLGDPAARARYDRDGTLAVAEHAGGPSPPRAPAVARVPAKTCSPKLILPPPQ
jgi:molecular chaperone DnaJ